MRTTTLFVLLLCGSFLFGQAKTDSGQLNGAAYQIDIPVNWNHGLVVYCHGYETTPGINQHSRPFVEAFLRAGYAVAQSAYSQTGWAVEQAAHDTEALRSYFIEKYGRPRETYVSGISMGGLLTTLLIEQHPDEYDAGLALCGALGSSLRLIKDHVFDERVVFDYYFPGALPPPSAPPGASAGGDPASRLKQLLDLHPKEASAVSQMAGTLSNDETANVMLFWTLLLEEMNHRAGGNAFDNRNTVYSGSADDYALNKGVKRYAADPRATEYLERFYTPTGNLQRPVLALHTTHDPVVLPYVPSGYFLTVTQAGKQENFVQQYVNRSGHCRFSPQDISDAFGELTRWKTQAAKPEAGELPKSGVAH